MLNDWLNTFSDLIMSTAHVEIAHDALIICLLFSAIGAAILAKFTGKIGEMTIGVTFSVLFMASFVSNWLLAGVDIPIILHQQELMVYTIVGMIMGSFALLWLTGPEGN